MKKTIIICTVFLLCQFSQAQNSNKEIERERAKSNSNESINSDKKKLKIYFNDESIRVLSELNNELRRYTGRIDEVEYTDGESFLYVKLNIQTAQNELFEVIQKYEVSISQITYLD